MTNHYQYTCTRPPAVLIEPVKLTLEDLALEELNSYRRLRHECATCEASGDEAAVERARSLLHFAEGRLADAVDALTRRGLGEERFHAGYTLVDVPDTVQAKPPEMPEPLWLVEEQLASGEWIPIEQTSDLAEAEQKLSTAENCFSGLSYRCNDLQSKWPRPAIIAFFGRD
ncbi:hypothetical protein [Pseudomonas syringae]|uniref:hypothetical protein n=1 Tax=Pseudomonas syringae TaxID=317 RepID=UPI002364D03D|nr:hypothetical protein [Pseudomonas syringae]GKQ49046.1 hypothetical protein PSTH2693_27840 [Pseudomonas syringae pv. theae]